MGVVNDFFRHHYQDRGMLKWQGFYLSDHTAAIKKENARTPVELKRLMSDNEIRDCLQDAWQNKIKLCIQLNEVNQNKTVMETQGYVKGFVEDQIYLLSDSDCILVKIESIRNLTKISTRLTRNQDK